MPVRPFVHHDPRGDPEKASAFSLERMKIAQFQGLLTTPLVFFLVPFTPLFHCYFPSGETWCHWPASPAGRRSWLRAAVQGDYDRRSNVRKEGPARLSQSSDFHGAGGWASWFSICLSARSPGHRRPARVRQAECPRPGGHPSCLPPTSGADAFQDAEEPGTSGLHGGLPGPLGRPSKNRQAPNRKQQQIISAVRERGKCGRSRAQRAQTAGNMAPDSLGTRQSSALRLERGQGEERILTPEALGSYRESQAGLFPWLQPPGLPGHPGAVISGNGQVLTTPWPG